MGSLLFGNGEKGAASQCVQTVLRDWDKKQEAEYMGAFCIISNQNPPCRTACEPLWTYCHHHVPVRCESGISGS